MPFRHIYFQLPFPMPRASCSLCHLSSLVKTPVMRALPNASAPLQVFVDYPTNQDDEFGYYGGSQVSRLTQWMLAKLSLSVEDVGINFTLRCCGASLKKKKEKLESITACSVYSDKIIASARALLGMGDLSCQRLIGKPLSSSVYQLHAKVLHCPVFISYSAGYVWQKPGELVDVERMLWGAAVAAGLEPIVDLEVADFDFQQI